MDINSTRQKLDTINEKIAQMFARHGIKRFYLTGAGNSLMSGYSMLHKTQPLFKRNTSLKAIFNKKDIEVLSVHYSRAQNNNDEHINDYFRNNITEKDIYALNRVDLLKEDTPAINMTDELLGEYYPANPEGNYGFRDLVLEKDPELANVLVYIGATGSFLDNVTRGGLPKLMSGFKRDYTSIESTLKDIQANNREQGTNTQVYLVGIPKYLGLPVIDLAINNHLKKMAQQYANVVYVEPIKAKLYYPKKGFDTHLNEEEYLEYNNAIMESIYENYLPVDATIAIDRELNRLNKEIELNVTQSLADTNEMDYGNLFNTLVDECGWPVSSAKKMVEDCKNAKSRSFKAIAEANFDAKILPLINHYVEVLEREGMDSRKFLKDMQKYLLARTPYDFYYAGKENISHIDSLPVDLEPRRR